MDLGSILIVDDHAEFRAVLRQILAPVAAEILECEDGETVLSVYLAKKPDWVLMDIRMPKIDGLSSTRELVARVPDVRVIILTSFPLEDVRQRALKAGALECASKDDLSQIAPMIRRLRGNT